MSDRPAASLFQRATPALFVLLWSSGFVGSKFGMPFAGPFTFLLIRLAIVSALLALAARAGKAAWPATPREAGHIAVAGMLVHGVYLGGVFFAISRGMGAGMVALIVGLQPLFTAVAASMWLGEKAGARQWTGLLLGLAGVALVVSQKISFEGRPSAMIAAGLALAGITIGTLYQKKYCTGMDLRSGTAIQYFVSALAMLFPAAAFEHFHVEWTGRFIFALSWLILVLSVGAIFLLFILIRQGRMAQVASLFYLTPPVTAIMAWAIFGEQLPPTVLAGFAIVAFGVALTRKGAAA